MKQFFLVSCLLCLSVPALSQVRVGVQAGYVWPSLNFSGPLSTYADLYSPYSSGVQAGGFLTIPVVGPLYIRPRLLYSVQTGEATVPALHAIQLPVELGLRLPLHNSALCVGAGGYVSHSSSRGIWGGLQNDAGLRGSISFEHKSRVGLQLFYEKGLTNISTEPELVIKNSVVGLTLQYEISR